MSKRKILFFGLSYHGYTTSIKAEMEALGFEVDYLDIQPRGFKDKVAKNLTPSRFWAKVHQAFADQMATRAQTDYAGIVFLQAHQMPLHLLKQLRQDHPGTPMVLYNWDSLANHDYRAQAPFFDEVLTFDRADAEANGWEYLPLFCLQHMHQLPRDKTDPASIYMVGNIVNTDRYAAAHSFASYARTQNIDLRLFLKVTPPIYLRLIRRFGFVRDVAFRSIAKADFATMIETSAATFDYANHAQSGHTMRVMENLCMGKKIVTNNPWVKKEPFYTPDRIFVYEGLDFTGVDTFLQTPLDDPDRRFAEYHVDAFTKRLVARIMSGDSARQPDGGSAA